MSVLVKLGALVFVLTLDSQFALNFQLLGGIWILQTIPTVLLGLFTERFADKRALLAGWAVGIAYGTIAAYNVSSPRPVTSAARRRHRSSCPRRCTSPSPR